MTINENGSKLLRKIDSLQKRIAELEEALQEQKHKADKTLKTSEETYHNLFQNAQVGLFRTRIEDGKILESNEQLARMFGYESREEFISEYITSENYVDPGTREKMLEEIREKGSIKNYEARFYRKDGSIFWALYSAKIYLEKGWIEGVAEDITELKEAQESLLKERNLLRTLIDAMPDFIYVKDTESRFIATNTANVRMLGAASPDDVIGKTDLDFYPGEHAEKYFKDEQHIIKTGKPMFNREEEVVDPEGRKYVVLTTKVPFRDATGRIAGIVGIGRDITEQKNLAKQLQQSQKLESIGRLAGGVAHDFNNMLSVILLHTEMVLSKLGSSDPLRDNLQQIHRAGERSEEIARQLLAFARKQIIEPKVLNLNETVEGMLRMLGRLIGEDIDISWNPYPELWLVRVDPTQMHQIMVNLCVNARDAIIGVGNITIETNNVVFDESYCAHHRGFIPGEFVMLAVSDDGCGMDSEVQKNIFEPFFTTKAAGVGTGLGLSTVYGIVKQNSGFIHVYSEPGYGTTFKIYLPRYTGKEAKWEERPETIQVPEGRGETILIVEDEESILQMVQKVLGDSSYGVLTAKTPQEALTRADDHTGDIHLLVTDVVMPDMNGKELAERLSVLYPDMKTLYMSGYTADVIAHRGILAEEINFIQKPFSMKELALKVRDALDST